MKKNIHPQWYPKAQVVCACGNTFTVGSTKAEIKVEICNKCHPFFTGQMKYIDTGGQIERFQKKQEVGQKLASSLASKKQKKSKQPQEEKQKTLKEMLLGL